MNYNLPKLPDGHRWYLSYYSDRYALLEVQRKRWWGWKKVTSELVCITGRQRPFEDSMRDAASDVIRVMNAPKVDYGVVT